MNAIETLNFILYAATFLAVWLTLAFIAAMLIEWAARGRR